MSSSSLSSIPGGSRELLKLALPLILSQSFFTLQIAVDRILLARYDTDAMAAAFPAAMLFWLAFGFFQGTAGYVSTFVAQYSGAGRPHRVGPAVWQGLHFGVVVGLLFPLLVPLAPWILALGGHGPDVQVLEVTYFQYLCWAALPMLIVSAVNGFFSGRGQTWTVLAIDGAGTSVNAGLALVLIFGRVGFPELGIAGAGWAAVIGAWVSALLGLALLLRPTYRQAFDTLRGWRPERDLFARLIKYGGPAGAQMMLDALAFTLFTFTVGQLSEAAVGATSLAVTLNMIAFLPMLGMGQAIAVLVGRRLGENRPDVAEQTTQTGLQWVFGFMCVVAAVYIFLPHTLLEAFQSDRSPEKFAGVAAIVPTLLLFVAIYSVADSVNVTFSFALRGAGDTQFVSLLTFALAWPIMVAPTYFIVRAQGSLYWTWAFASAYICTMSLCFWLRFRTGKWKTMRVIERASEGGSKEEK